MKENKLNLDSKRLKRPRIQQATVPGEFEKVYIRYELKSSQQNKAEPMSNGENLNYTITTKRGIKKTKV